MNPSRVCGNALLIAYSLVKQSGFLGTALGRRLFRSTYFAYKRLVEDNLADLLLAFPDLVAGGDVLDIGANLGYTAAVLARATLPDALIYAFEPEPSNFRILEQTARRPAFQGKIIPLQLAVGAEEGTADLWINERHHADHRVVTEKSRPSHPGATHVSVSLTSIDSFLATKPRNICFAKIDVQGYELAVCRGMRNTLLQNPDLSVVLEFMPSAMRNLGFEPQELIDFFCKQGFSVYQVHAHGKLSPGIPPTIKDADYIDLVFTRRSIKNNRKLH